jgi:hypothetical protein
VFGDKCLYVTGAPTVLEIPGLHYKKLQQLSAAGIVDLSNLPDDLGLNPRQQRAVQSVQTGRLIVEDGLAAALDAMVWPCRYLDFETVMTALPMYEGHGCHEQVLTQFSIHERDSIAGELRHIEYLADATRDCQRDLANALCDALGRDGSILVYSAFEKSRIKQLAQLFPDLAEPLEAILDRLVDLLAIITNHVYHPEFHGSFSIKKVLPALVPDLSYDHLEIRNGKVAVERFARMARGQITGNEVETTRSQLLKYCELDTLAMVRLHDKLAEVAAGRTSVQLPSAP